MGGGSCGELLRNISAPKMPPSMPNEVLTSSITKKNTMVPTPTTAPVVAPSKMDRSSGGNSDARSSMRRDMASCTGASARLTGIEMISQTNAPTTPARSPAIAPSPMLIGSGWFCCIRYAASAPPNRIQAQQQLARLMTGSADSTPIARPPSNAGCVLAGLIRSVVVLAAEVSNHFLAHHVAQRVLQLHQLDEQVVLRIEVLRMHRRLVVERQPLLDAGHPGALGQVQEQR